MALGFNEMKETGSLPFCLGVISGIGTGGRDTDSFFSFLTVEGRIFHPEARDSPSLAGSNYLCRRLPDLLRGLRF